MEKLDGRLVVVEVTALADLLELARLAASQAGLDPALSDALAAAAAQIETHSALEP